MFHRNFFLDILDSMTSEYVNKLETVSNERRAFSLMENVGLYTQPILAEQERTRKAIESLQDSNKETTPKKQIEFQDTFQIDSETLTRTCLNQSDLFLVKMVLK